MVFMRVCQPEKLKKEFDKKFSAHMSNIEDHVLKDKSCAEILIGFILKMDEETMLQSAGRDRSFLCAQQCRNSCWGLWAYPLCVFGFFWEGQQVLKVGEEPVLKFLWKIEIVLMCAAAQEISVLLNNLVTKRCKAL